MFVIYNDGGKYYCNKFHKYRLYKTTVKNRKYYQTIIVLFVERVTVSWHQMKEGNS